MAFRTHSMHDARSENGTGKDTGWIPIRETHKRVVEHEAVGELTEGSKRLLARALAEPDDDSMVEVNRIEDRAERKRAQGRLRYRESKDMAGERRMINRGWI